MIFNFLYFGKDDSYPKAPANGVNGDQDDLVALIPQSITATLCSLTILSGGNSKRATPDPIPNSVVKPLCADGTAFV